MFPCQNLSPSFSKSHKYSKSEPQKSSKSKDGKSSKKILTNVGYNASIKLIDEYTKNCHYETFQRSHSADNASKCYNKCQCTFYGWYYSITLIKFTIHVSKKKTKIFITETVTKDSISVDMCFSP